MPLVEDTIEIAAPPERIWDYLIDPDKGVLWQQSMLELAKEGPGAIEKGSTYRGVIKVAGRKMPWTAEVTELEPNRRVAYKSTESPVSFTIQHTLENLGGRTRMSVRNESGSLGSFFGKLADPIVVKLYERSLRADLDSLKTLVEAG
jgi:uncharacterized protein YndB with AHSA1/START domain